MKSHHNCTDIQRTGVHLLDNLVEHTVVMLECYRSVLDVDASMNKCSIDTETLRQ